jgi:hypothetical protein
MWKWSDGKDKFNPAVLSLLEETLLLKFGF